MLRRHAAQVSPSVICNARHAGAPAQRRPLEQMSRRGNGLCCRSGDIGRGSWTWCAHAMNRLLGAAGTAGVRGWGLKVMMVGDRVNAADQVGKHASELTSAHCY